MLTKIFIGFVAFFLLLFFYRLAKATKAYFAAKKAFAETRGIQFEDPENQTAVHHREPSSRGYNLSKHNQSFEAFNQKQREACNKKSRNRNRAYMQRQSRNINFAG